MKILFIGDYSNLHSCIASELRSRGHQATVLSDRCGFMNTHADICIKREPGIMGGIKYLYTLLSLLPDLKGYDVVQIINPNFLELRPGKIKYLFDRLRRQNGSMFLTLASNDYFFVKACHEAEIFRFSEFKTGKRNNEYTDLHPELMYGWISEHNYRLNSYIYEKVNGAMSVLPEYDMAARPLLSDRLLFTNLPIDLSSLKWSPLDAEKPVRILVGMKSGMEMRKGTDRLLAIAKELQQEMPDRVIADTARDLPLVDYISKLERCHIVLDQLYSYSPATNALQAMALGKVAASGAQPEYYNYIGNPETHPVIPLSPLHNDIKEVLRQLVCDSAKLISMGREGRKLVERHNDVKIVADKFLTHWENLG